MYTNSYKTCFTCQFYFRHEKVILFDRSRLRALVVSVFAHDMQIQVEHGLCKQGCCMISNTANKRIVTIAACYNCTPVSPTSTCLTRFNKIAIQGTPQMTADKEGISVSSMYSYHSKCNRPPILSVTRLCEILVYSVLEQINSTRMYTIS